MGFNLPTANSAAHTVKAAETKPEDTAGTPVAPETTPGAAAGVPLGQPPQSAETPPVVTESVLTLAMAQPTERPRVFYMASQWDIQAAEGVDMIHAVHNQTHDVYDGAISDFNAMMRGE